MSRLDPKNACLWRGAEEIRLTPKAFAVLQVLVAHAGQLVTKEALLKEVWPGVAVTDAALTVCVREIRRRLGDDAQAPTIIETRHRLGYCLIAPVTAAFPAPPAATPGDDSVVGRERDLQRLRECFARARERTRQVVFVTGETGIGKTSLVDRFLAELASERPWLARGQCIEYAGAGEAYIPVLDAVGALCRGDAADTVIDTLGRYAPTWLAQMPSLVPARPAATPASRRALPGRERMLREIVDALEALARDRPLVLAFDDLQWSDRATIDLIGWLARRREPARLLLLGAYRPADVLVTGHPLRTVTRELAIHGQCKEIALDLLTEADVRRYLALRFPGGPTVESLAGTIHRQTDGNPLFVTAVTEALLKDEWLVERAGRWEARAGAEPAAMAVPPSVRELVDQHYEALSPEQQQVLEAASAVGVEFSTAAVAAATETALDTVEDRCAELARRGQFLRASAHDVWADGTTAGRYRFVHGLHQHVVYERLVPARRVQVHRRIGAWAERAYGPRVEGRTAELARHFLEGRDCARAIHYLGLAAQTAMRRSAFHEAVAHVRVALTVLETVPPGPERQRRELDLHVVLGPALMATQGFASAQVGDTYGRMRALSEELGSAAERLPSLWGLRTHHTIGGRMRLARQVSEEFLARAQEEGDATYIALGHVGLGFVLHYLGEPAGGRTHLERGIALAPQAPRPGLGLPIDQNPWLLGVRNLSFVLGTLGYPDQALVRAREAVAFAASSSDTPNLIAARVYLARIHQFRGEPGRTREEADAARELARNLGFAQRLAAACILGGWARAVGGEIPQGLAEVVEGIAAFRATGAQDDVPYWLALRAELHLLGGDVEAASASIDEALAVIAAGGARNWAPELHRLRADVMRRRGGQSSLAEAEASLQQAITIARGQASKSLELRAALDLAALRAGRRDRAAARDPLAAVYGWFSEGFDTKDLSDARALLARLDRKR